MNFDKGQIVSFDIGLGRADGEVISVNSKTVWVKSDDKNGNQITIKRHIVKHRVAQVD